MSVAHLQQNPNHNPIPKGEPPRARDWLRYRRQLGFDAWFDSLIHKSDRQLGDAIFKQINAFDSTIILTELQLDLPNSLPYTFTGNQQRATVGRKTNRLALSLQW